MEMDMDITDEPKSLFEIVSETTSKIHRLCTILENKVETDGKIKVNLTLTGKEQEDDIAAQREVIKKANHLVHSLDYIFRDRSGEKEVDGIDSTRFTLMCMRCREFNRIARLDGNTDELSNSLGEMKVMEIESLQEEVKRRTGK
jgi:hypothetical protein